jgi:hypothetical protein
MKEVVRDAVMLIVMTVIDIAVVLVASMALSSSFTDVAAAIDPNVRIVVMLFATIIVVIGSGVGLILVGQLLAIPRELRDAREPIPAARLIRRERQRDPAY